MRNCSAIIQALYCAIGLCSSILLGVCVLMISAYMPVPDALYRRYGEEVSFHVTSKRQMLIENQLPLGVVADSIAHLRQEDCAIWDRPISELNRLYARLYDASKDGAAAIGSIQANRIYLYEHDVLYAFSIPATYGLGGRAYFCLRWQIIKQLALYLRVSETVYSDLRTKTDLHFLLRATL